jgi:hypothetical protein
VLPCLNTYKVNANLVDFITFQCGTIAGSGFMMRQYVPRRRRTFGYEYRRHELRHYKF